MRRIFLLPAILLAACASRQSSPSSEPDWQGPPLRAWSENGSIDVVISAPTAGHELEVVDVDTQGAVATARLVYRKPAQDAVVAQVVTDLHAEVRSANMPANVRTVRVMVAAVTPGQEARPDYELAAVVQRHSN